MSPIIITLFTILPALAGLNMVAAAPFQARQIASAAPQYIHPNGNTTLCLSVVNPANDAPVQVLECPDPAFTVPAGSGSVSQAWTIVPGENQVVSLVGTDFCLDAGSNPGDFSPGKVYTCYPGLAAQNWWYTDDLHIALTNGNQCLDVLGHIDSTGDTETYQCTYANTNQIFTTSLLSNDTITSSLAPAAAASSAASGVYTVTEEIVSNGGTSTSYIAFTSGVTPSSSSVAVVVSTSYASPAATTSAGQILTITEEVVSGTSTSTGFVTFTPGAVVSSSEAVVVSTSVLAPVATTTA